MNIINPRAVHQVLLSTSEIELIEAIRADPHHFSAALRHLEALEKRVTNEVSTENSFAAEVIAECLEGIDAEINIERLQPAS